MNHFVRALNLCLFVSLVAVACESPVDPVSPVDEPDVIALEQHHLFVGQNTPSARSPRATTSVVGRTDQPYFIVNIPGPFETTPFDINDHGHIVGIVIDDSGVLHGYRWDGRTYSLLDVPDGIQTRAQGVNNYGTVVGRYTDGGGTVHGFSWKGSGFSTIDVPGSVFTSIIDINNADQMVGFFIDDTGFHGFVYDGSDFTTVDLAGVDLPALSGINDLGQIVGDGVSFATGISRGFLYDEGTFTMIDVPGATSTSARGINNAGQVTGFFADATGSHSYVYDGDFTIVDTEGLESALLAISNTKALLGITLSDAGEDGLLITHRGNHLPRGAVAQCCVVLDRLPL